MKKFVYRGPLSSVHLEDGEKIVTLVDGETYELPEEHEHVAALIEHKRLVTPPPPAKEEPAAKPTKEEKKSASSTSSSPNADQSPPSKRGQQGAR